MRITINLSSMPYLDVDPLVKRLRIVTVTLGILTLCAAILLGFVHFSKNAFQREEHQLDGTIAHESDELSTYRKMLEAPENVGVANRALALNTLFEEKSFSWTTLMKQLEGVMPNEVQLATIQPVRSKDGSIQIRMHVIGPREQVIVFIHGIEASNNFILPHVTGETAHNDARANQRPLALTASSVEEFDIEAGYSEDAAWPSPAGSTVAADRETASAAPAVTDKKKPAPAQLTAAVVSATSLPEGGTR